MPSKVFLLVIAGIIFSLVMLTPNFQQVYAEDVIVEYPDFNINATQGEIQKIPTIPPLEPKASSPQLILKKELPDPPEVEEEAEIEEKEVVEEIVEEILVEEILVEEIEDEGVEEVDTITIIIIIVVIAAIVIAIIRRR